MSDHTPEDHDQLDDQSDQADAQADADKARQAAHVILDGLSAVDPEQPDSQANVDAMELAFAKLLEIEAIELLYDEDEEELELDVSPLMEGVLLVVRRLVAELAERTGTSPEDVVAGVRTHLDG